MSSTVTADQNAYNLKTASRNVGATLGVDPDNLDYTQRVSFNKALAQYILDYPQSFTDQTLSTAQYVSGKSYQDLQNTDLSWSDFGNAVVDNAGNLASGFTFTLLPTLAIMAVVVFIAVNYLPGAIAKAKSS